MNDNHPHTCPACRKEFLGRINKIFCSRTCAEKYNRLVGSIREPKVQIITAEMVRAAESKPRRNTQIYRRGTKDMPKCKHPSCHNRLYWSCERATGECIQCRNRSRRNGATVASIPGGHVVAERN